MLQDLAIQLADVLNSECAIYEDFLEIAKNKTKVVTDGKIKELEDILKVEQALVVLIGKLEGEREKLIEKMALLLQKPAQDLTISVLSEYIKDEAGNRLSRLRDSMMKTIRELEAANDLNAKLIRNSLDYVNFTINLATSAPGAGNNTYGNKGSINELKVGKSRNLFDARF